jgi:ubiquinone/menaquinone biosynthesis C-methylase UbiE
MNSKWGYEEIETLEAIKEINFVGKVLNLAAGDGRFNNKLLECANEVTAVDIDEKEMINLINDCPSDLRGKLFTMVTDITKKLPFEDNTFDGIFCTGALHLFDRKIIIKIMSEIRRVLKLRGKIVIDFAADIKRIKENGELITFEGEGNYSTKQSIDMFNKLLTGFDIKIKEGHVEEIFLDEVKYNFSCNFIVVYGKKRKGVII